jgi:hypothetical protein
MTSDDMLEAEEKKILEICDDSLTLRLISESIRYRQVIVNRLTMYDFSDLDDLRLFTGSSVTKKKQELIELIQRYPILGCDNPDELKRRVRTYGEREKHLRGTVTVPVAKPAAKPAAKRGSRSMESRDDKVQQDMQEMGRLLAKYGYQPAPPRQGSAHPSRQGSAQQSRHASAQQSRQPSSDDETVQQEVEEEEEFAEPVLG